MRIQQIVASYEKSHKWKIGLIGQANKSKVVYLSADPTAGTFKGRLPLVCWTLLRNVKKLLKRYDWLISWLFFCLRWYSTIQYRKGKLRWIFFVCMFFKTNYIGILLRYVMFHVQVQIGLYVMPPTLESFNRPFMRLWFYNAFIKIEFGSSVRSYHWNYTKF